MASVPSRLLLPFGVFISLFVFTSADDYLIATTGNCTDSPHMPFWAWSKQPKNGSFHCILYKTKCSDAEVPDHLKDPGNFVGRPQSLDVRPFSKNTPNKVILSGINITWTPPPRASQMNQVKGFQIGVYPVMGNAKTFCRIFDFSANNFTSTDVQLSFAKTLFPVRSNNIVYMIGLSALPRPASGARAGLDRYQGVRPQPRRNGGIGEPIDWSAPLTYNNATAGQVTAGFGLAPDQFGFEHYRLEIVPENATNVYQFIVINKTSLSDKSWARWTFTNLPNCTWRIRVQPIDPFFNDYKKCLCYQGTDILDNRNCASCMVTQSAEFLTVPAVSTIKTSLTTTPSTTSASTSTTTKESTPVFNQSTEASKIAGSVVGTILGVSLVGVIGYFLWIKRKSTGETSFEKCFNNNNNNNNKNKPLHPTISIIPSGLSLKTVFIVSADDHQHHRQVIELFAIYLQKYCKCDVVYAPWRASEIQTRGNGNLWAITNINKCDYTIIINSEAAFNLFEAVKDQTRRPAYKNPDAGPEGDLFTPSIMHVVSKLSDRQSFPKLIMASFEYTNDEHIISEIPGLRYKVPKHLSNLLCHIHMLDTQAIITSLRINDLPSGDNMAETPEGKNLEKAIRSATVYERRNPKWFKDLYMRTDSGFHSAAPDDLHSPSNNHYEEQFIAPDDLQSVSCYPFVDPSLDNFAGTIESNSAITYFPPDNKEDKQHGDHMNILPREYFVPPDGIESPGRFVCLENTGISDQFVPPKDTLSPDQFVPPEDIVCFESLSMTLSDRLREVNMFSDMDDELFEPPQSDSVPLDCQSIGGKSV